MKVILAGYNLDIEILKGLKGEEALTPETIAAAYARISRSPRSLPELRKDARQEVAKARKSAKTIIYDMGHHSIAEHAVFNFDISGVSRLAVEEIERFRLVSYTEKSQRYVQFEKGFFVPREIKSTPYEREFSSLVERQFDYYKILCKKLKERLLKENKEMKERDAELRAKEDARYCLPLATTTQLGMTINARNLEYLLRNFAVSPLREIRELGKRLFSQVKEIAPSLFLFYKATPYEERGKELQDLVGRLSGQKSLRDGDVKLLYYNPASDLIIATSLLYPHSPLSFGELEAIAKGHEKEILKTACQHLEFYDTLPREFELSYLIFEITLSASAFAQLKRHRMATLIKKPYCLKEGFVLPLSIAKIGEEKRFKRLIEETNALFRKLKREYPKIR